VTQTNEDPILRRLLTWAQEQELVRALILEGSRGNPSAPLDRLSDYDVMVIVRDIRPFVNFDAWHRWYGVPLRATCDRQDLRRHRVADEDGL
jgi:aminoglycoside 6-adenylyltransferase